jgi:hypothetical protein
VQPVDLAFLGEGVGPPCPRQPLGESLLDDHIVQAEIALLATMASPDPGDQQPHQCPRGKGHHPQKPVQSIVSPAGQEERHACLRLAPIQEDQPRYVQCDKGDSGWAAHPAYAETTQHEGNLGGQRTGGTIQSGRHGETSVGYGWFGQTASYPVVASLGFRTDESPYCVSPVSKLCVKYLFRFANTGLRCICPNRVGSVHPNRGRRSRAFPGEGSALGLPGSEIGGRKVHSLRIDLLRSP